MIRSSFMQNSTLSVLIAQSQRWFSRIARSYCQPNIRSAVRYLMIFLGSPVSKIINRVNDVTLVARNYFDVSSHILLTVLSFISVQ